MDYVHPIAFIKTELFKFIDRDEKAEGKDFTPEGFLQKLKGYYDELKDYPCKPMARISFSDFEDAAKRMKLRVEEITKIYAAREARARRGGLF